jgi:hypothetical protein
MVHSAESTMVVMRAWNDRGAVYVTVVIEIIEKEAGRAEDEQKEARSLGRKLICLGRGRWKMSVVGKTRVCSSRPTMSSTSNTMVSVLWRAAYVDMMISQRIQVKRISNARLAQFGLGQLGFETCF